MLVPEPAQEPFPLTKLGRQLASRVRSQVPLHHIKNDQDIRPGQLPQISGPDPHGQLKQPEVVLLSAEVAFGPSGQEVVLVLTTEQVLGLGLQPEPAQPS